MTINSDFHDDEDEIPDFKPMISWWEITAFLFLVAFILYVCVMFLIYIEYYRWIVYLGLGSLGIYTAYRVIKDKILDR